MQESKKCWVVRKYMYYRKVKGHIAYYGVATISRLLKIKGLFWKRALWRRLYYAKLTYHWVVRKYMYCRKEKLHIAYCGVATISRLLKIKGLFCKRALWRRLYYSEQTYHWVVRKYMYCRKAKLHSAY